MILQELKTTITKTNLTHQELVSLLKLNKCDIHYTDVFSKDDILNTINFIENFKINQGFSLRKWRLLSNLEINVFTNLINNNLINQVTVCVLIEQAHQNTIRLNAFYKNLLSEFGINQDYISLEQAFDLLRQFKLPHTNECLVCITPVNSLQEYIIRISLYAYNYMNQEFEKVNIIDCMLIPLKPEYDIRYYIQYSLTTLITDKELLIIKETANSINNPLSELGNRVLQNQYLISKYPNIQSLLIYFLENLKSKLVSTNKLTTLLSYWSTYLSDNYLDVILNILSRCYQSKTNFIEQIKHVIDILQLTDAQKTFVANVSHVSKMYILNTLHAIPNHPKLLGQPEFLNKLNYLITCTSNSESIEHFIKQQASSCDLNTLPEVHLSNYTLLIFAKFIETN